MIRRKVFNVMIAAFSQIFLNSLFSHVSKPYPLKHCCPLPSTCWVVRLQTSVLLFEDVWLLRQHHPFVVTSPRPRPNNLLSLINTWLSSNSLASLDVAHGPIPLSNSPITKTKLIRKKFTCEKWQKMAYTWNNSQILEKIWIFVCSKKKC